VVGEEIVKHKSTPVISFTGGTKTGRKIASIASKKFKKLSLEMGGKNPNIIFSDTNLKKAVDWAVKSSFLNQGQICLCGSRLFIERGVYNDFKKLFIKKTKSLVLGSPKKENSFLGAVVSKDHMQNILNKISIAKKLGGVILTGGKRKRLPGVLRGGYFVEPTIIEGLGYLTKTNQEEIFGPVVCLIPFDSEEGVIKMANSTVYGLSASIFTENISKAHRVARKIKSGVVWINSWLIRDLRIPFGGMKNSGLGREGGFDSLNFFTEQKNVCLKIDSED
jgi:aminomuconate-semialdehyde/2-hydroxymuconate-6-semialdehyde dehydrogenase